MVGEGHSKLDIHLGDREQEHVVARLNRPAFYLIVIIAVVIRGRAHCGIMDGCRA